MATAASCVLLIACLMLRAAAADEGSKLNQDELLRAQAKLVAQLKKAGQHESSQPSGTTSRLARVLHQHAAHDDDEPLLPESEVAADRQLVSGPAYPLDFNNYHRRHLIDGGLPVYPIDWNNYHHRRHMIEGGLPAYPIDWNNFHHRRHMIEGPAYPLDFNNYRRHLIDGEAPAYPIDYLWSHRHLIEGGNGPAYPLDFNNYHHRRHMITPAYPLDFNNYRRHLIDGPNGPAYPVDLSWYRRLISGPGYPLDWGLHRRHLGTGQSLLPSKTVASADDDNMEVDGPLYAEPRLLDETEDVTPEDCDDGSWPSGENLGEYRPVYGGDPIIGEEEDADQYTPSIMPQGYCYCRVDQEYGGFVLDDEECKQSLYTRADDATAGLDLGILDKFYNTNRPAQVVRDYLNDFLYWDCRAAPPCQCKNITDVAALTECAQAVKDFEANPTNDLLVTDFVTTSTSRVLEPSFQEYAYMYIPWIQKWAQEKLSNESCDAFAGWPGSFDYMAFSEVYAPDGSRRKTTEVAPGAAVAAAVAEGEVMAAANSRWPSVPVVAVMAAAAVLLVALPTVLIRRRSATGQTPVTDNSWL